MTAKFRYLLLRFYEVGVVSLDPLVGIEIDLGTVLYCSLYDRVETIKTI